MSDLTKKKKKLKKRNGDEDEYNPESDYPVHEKYTKEEMLVWERERQKLDRFYGGISDLKSIPDAVFIIDTHLEDLAVRESQKMGVTTVGIVDTNADPEGIDYPIPANDDAVGSIKLITTYIIDAWIEGKKKATKTQSEEAQKEVKVTKEPEEKQALDTKVIAEGTPKKRGRKKKTE